MSNFTIRVYLHDANEENAAELDKIMGSYGFKLTISSDTGKTYKLPPGEYSFTGDLDRKSLIEKTKAAAGQVGKKYSLLITESKGRTWHNLSDVAKIS